MEKWAQKDYFFTTLITSLYLISKSSFFSLLFLWYFSFSSSIFLLFLFFLYSYSSLFILQSIFFPAYSILYLLTSFKLRYKKTVKYCQSLQLTTSNFKMVILRNKSPSLNISLFFLFYHSPSYKKQKQKCKWK